jgi:hypothetical protein
VEAQGATPQAPKANRQRQTIQRDKGRQTWLAERRGGIFAETSVTPDADHRDGSSVPILAEMRGALRLVRRPEKLLDGASVIRQAAHCESTCLGEMPAAQPRCSQEKKR